MQRAITAGREFRACILALGARSFIAFVLAPAPPTPAILSGGNSTAAVGYVLAPIFLGFSAAGGYLLGLILRGLLGVFAVRAPSAHVSRTIAATLLVGVPALVAVLGAAYKGAELRKRVAAVAPRVLQSTTKVFWQDPPSRAAARGMRPATLVWASGMWPDDSAIKALPAFEHDRGRFAALSATSDSFGAKAQAAIVGGCGTDDATSGRVLRVRS